MSFSIAFDYRFDPTGFYDDPAVRAVMDRAAEIWSGLIEDDFDEVRAGTTFSIANPSVSGQRETITLDEDIDDLLIFAGARDISALGRGGFAGTDAEGDVLRSRISDDFRNGGPVTDFEPWAGVVVLDLRYDWSYDLDGPVAGKNDLLTTVLHEIGHILGIGTAPAFDALVVDHAFTGVNAVAANGGTDVPLEEDHGHVQNGHDGGEVLLDPVTMTGTRKLPGALDLAMLADIGYEIAGYTAQGSTPPLATMGEETVFGTLLDDLIEGLAGDDQLQGDLGDDTLLGGEGDDTAFGQEGDDWLEGGPGADQLQGNAGHDTLLGSAGSDTLFGQDGNDFIRGGPGDDFLLGDTGDDTLRGGLGDDSIRTGDGSDRVVIEPGMGSDTVYDFTFGRDTLDIAALSAEARAGMTITGSDTFKHIRFADGEEIYLQGTIADTDAGVTLAGAAVQNATLTATFTGAMDLFGTPSTQAQAYSWLRDGVAIDGATGSTYTLGQADVGAQIAVSAQYTGSAGITRITTTATAPVQNVNDLPTGAVLLVGTARPGGALEAVTTTLDDADGLGSFDYQWLRDGTAIAGATGARYTVAAPDADAAIAVTVRYTDGQGTQESLTSAARIAVQDTAADPPGPDTPVTQSEDLDSSDGQSIPPPDEDPPDPEPDIDPSAALLLTGDAEDNRLEGGDLGDTLHGGGGRDTLIGGAGDDVLTGGEGAGDLRDVIYGGDGDDTIDGSHGNDELRGDAGDDVIAGGFGADLVIGGAGDDTLTGAALGDTLFGGGGDDFINGGFGFDQINGGAGADSFFHLGISDHGADWIQDYLAADGDTLVFGNARATAAQFQINSAFTPGAGDADVAEAFVIYKPTGQILWALVDGMAQDEIGLTIDGTLYDLSG
ncbi:hypothetical protein [uncultured Sulfitobacter sp.]|uniref:hypothetical protein n=1 Tax=uncultured Sulfitobacter sp. TaxID=191468 RepID=UPI00260FC663|nr:hypothetical protein [uncultured Sulfitobacter sp.]